MIFTNYYFISGCLISRLFYFKAVLIPFLTFHSPGNDRQRAQRFFLIFVLFVSLWFNNYSYRGSKMEMKQKVGWLMDWAEAVVAGPSVSGGKGWNLGRLHRYGFPVPEGCVLS